MLIISVLLLPVKIKANEAPVEVNEIEALSLCIDALDSTERTVKGLHTLTTDQVELIQKISDQRARAYEMLGNQEQGVPWYIWALTGLAVGAFVTIELKY